MTDKQPIIRASEIGEYVYCRRAWWLKAVARVPAPDTDGRLARGEAAHAEHGAQVAAYSRSSRIARLCFIAAALCLIVGMVLLVLAR